MAAVNKTIMVYADWEEIGNPVLMGNLMTTHIRGKEIFSFEYATEWLGSAHVTVIDPGLQLYKGPQYTSDDKPNFGIFLDSSPDRWGRMLMKEGWQYLPGKRRKTRPRCLNQISC